MDINQGIDQGISNRNPLRLGWVVLTNIALLLVIAAPSLAQSETSLKRYFRNDPTQLTGDKGGGSHSLASIAKIADNCRGFANTAPNHTIHLTEPFPLLDFLVDSQNVNGDPTMLIKGPDGIAICGESKGRFTQITLSLPNGRLPKGDYEVWVGSKIANQSFAYTLYLSETPQR